MWVVDVDVVAREMLGDVVDARLLESCRHTW